MLAVAIGCPKRGVLQDSNTRDTGGAGGAAEAGTGNKIAIHATSIMLLLYGIEHGSASLVNPQDRLCGW